MSIRFVLGRAGSGKTAHCIGGIRERLIESPADGPRLLLLVPEQASFQMERALLADDLVAYHRCDVLSFKRLAFRVLADHGPDTPVLSSFARAMVVRHLLAKHAGRLKYFGRVTVSGTAFRRLADTLVELFEQALDPEQLDAKQLIERTDPLLAAKLGDLALLYRAYLDYLGTDRLDAAQYLDQARAQLPNCDWLENALLWVDGFAGFTGQELGLLLDLFTLVAHADVTFLLDPNDRLVNDPAAELDPYDLFAPTHRTVARLRALCVRQGISVDPPLLLEAAPPPRFAHNAEIAQLERWIFRWPTPAEDSQPRTAVRLIEASDRRTEVAHTLAQIRRWVSRRNDPLRYRQIAVVVRDLDRYHDLLVAELSSKSIPFFIDRRRSTAHHALVDLIRGLVAVPAAGFSLPSTRLLLKTGLLDCTDDQADELENYLLAHGIEGLAAWQSDRWRYHRNLTRAEIDDEHRDEIAQSLDHIHEIRRTFWSPLADWFAFAADGPHSVKAWVDALTACLDRLDITDKVNAILQSAVDEGLYEEAEEHRQVLADVKAILADLADALGAETIDVADLAALLETGLAELSVALPPPTVDQLLVSSIERSRHPDIRAACILGFNESVFPLAAGQDPILGDDDRDLLAGRGIELRPTRRQRLLEERYLAYVAVTRPSDFLTVSYPVADEDGSALRPSPFVRDLIEALPGLEAEKIGDPAFARKLWAIHTAGDLAAALAFEMRTRPPRNRDDAFDDTFDDAVDNALDDRRRFNALYLAARDDQPLRKILAPTLAALAYDNRAVLTPNDVEALHKVPLETSISQLEQFAACPFKHFAGYALRLEQRETAELQNIDLGSLLHKVLEDIVADLIAHKTRFADLDDRQIEQRVDRALDKYKPDVNAELAFQQPRNRFLIEQGRRHLIDALHLQRELSRASRLTPVGTEVAFGMKTPGSLPALEVKTPKNRRVLLRGFIDRVDVADGPDGPLAVVHDYKRSLRRKLELDKVYHGLSLQLPAYMLAIREVGQPLTGKPLRPIAAFFDNLLRSLKTESRPPDELPDDRDLAGRFKPRGLIDADLFGVLDGDHTTGQSQYFSAYVKKDGEIGHLDGGDLAPKLDFDALLDYVHDRMGALADQILDGLIEVKPYRLRNLGPCSYCEFKDVCRFEYHPASVRNLPPLKRTAVFDLLANREATP